MKLTKLFVGALALSAMLVACDSDSASAKDTEIEELSSSSAVEIASSSSTIRNDSLSSSAIESSSSSVMESSSSSETTQSSSSSENISAGSVYDATAKTLTDLRDGQTYKTVVIGEQTWMAENLNYADSVTTASLKGKSWCYDGVAGYCEKYGRLYTWAAAKTVCPEGWHLPSYDEWNTLFTAVGGISTAGAKLKSQTGWAAYDGITNEDSFGFSALPAGYRNSIGNYYGEGNYAYFWSSTEYGSNYAYYMYLYYGSDYAYLDYYSKYYGLSVRCVKD
ncbi:fibrobacter succinogenes major paralogous domain-containing protein [uncultured Fibrobacter sp.]|uniref:fibrobacter succinogenes major paralogous domain-containing protein n=1 Tax=uncultured Fibrobacter sp. TaxID=261512 RepID=UPI0025F12B0F|nr:fibrobacter succinogenes major paralogous domain-containing protein [uncultured Fibrobacter sp.]